MSPTILDRVIKRLVDEPVSFHAVGDEPRCWNALPGTLRLIARHLAPGARTLETGSGASTVVFAAAGARHTAVSPDGGEHARIVAYCQAQDISTDDVQFIVGRSDDVLSELPRDDEAALDAAFIDGAHAFPYAVIDFHHVSRRLRPGGLLFIDDIPIPSVAVVFRHMDADAAWERLEIADDRAAVFRKVTEPEGGDPWLEQPFNRGYPDYSFVPTLRRLALSVRHHLAAIRGDLAKQHPALARMARGLRRRG